MCCLCVEGSCRGRIEKRICTRVGLDPGDGRFRHTWANGRPKASVFRLHEVKNVRVKNRVGGDVGEGKEREKKRSERKLHGQSGHSDESE